MPAEIHDRGRGPEIKGTRITVYDVMDYHTHGRDPAYIASVLRLTPEEVDVALRYVDEHRDDVSLQYQRILEFTAQAQVGEEERVVAARGRLLAKKRELEHSRGQSTPTAKPPNARAAG